MPFLRRAISTDLERDFNFIYPNTDSTDNSMGTPAGTLFTNLNYYELELYQSDINNVLSTNGGIIRISFPDRNDFPVLSLNGASDIRLYRSSYILFEDPDERFFRNSQEINVSKYNDLLPRTGLSRTFAYVSMYIVASGINPTGFTPIYSKPTHINIFKLPDK